MDYKGIFDDNILGSMWPLSNYSSNKFLDNIFIFFNLPKKINNTCLCICI